MGGWSIEKELLEYIKKLLPKGSPILEFGIGTGTEALLKHFQVISVEHDPKYCDAKSKRHQCVFAPIENGWYNINRVRETILNKNFYLILVDGPPGSLREGILKNTSLFNSIDSLFIFDDVNRKKDYEIMHSFCMELNLQYDIVKGNLKSFSVCRKE